MKSSACLALVLALSAAPAPGAVIVVDVAGGGDCTTIQEGIDVSASGDTVLVMPGTYTGPQNRNLNPGSRSIVLRSQAGADSTIIDCEAASRAFYFGTAVDSLATVEGFTITNGQEAAGAGGALSLTSGASPTIRSCVFVGNSAVNGGAVLCHSGTAPRFFDCAFEDNTASVWGGAMHCRNCTALMVNCVFTWNTAAEGGALQSYTGDLTIRDCTFSENTSSGAGGAASLKSSSSCSMSDCLVFQNDSTSGAGGGIYCDDASALALQHTGIEVNTASSDGGGVFLANGSVCEMDSTWFVENTSAIAGGGISAQNSAIDASWCTFNANSANWRGGAAYLTGAADTLRSSFFSLNSAGQDGGGVYIQGASVTMSDCSFEEGNQAGGSGGALFANFAPSGTCSGCTFRANTATQGGGVFLNQSAVTLSDALFDANVATAGGGGGGLVIDGSAVAVTSTVFAGNVAPYGAGVWLHTGNHTIAGCTFVSNTATNGSAVRVMGPATASISNSIMAFGSGDAPVLCEMASPTITHCDVFGNAGSDSLCGDYHDNLFADPRFCSMGSGGFHLCANSPCLESNNVWNELIGALGQGCPDCESAVRRTTWGEIKALYR